MKSTFNINGCYRINVLADKSKRTICICTIQITKTPKKNTGRIKNCVLHIS